MNYTLNDNERTLLSAFMDGELSSADIQTVDALLARSAEARQYLDELRTVGALSGSALAVPVAAGSGSLGATAKLTGSAIQAAAKRATLLKGAATGSWGLAGTVGALAVAAVGVAVMLKNPPEPESRHAAQIAGTSRPAQTPMVPVSLLDTSNLIVPPMNKSDLVRFAIDGTLPIDAGRKRFLTLAPKGNDSLAVTVHARPSSVGEHEYAALQALPQHMLDSLQSVVRTAVLNSKRGIALRSDISTLRLNLIRTLEQHAPALSSQVRRDLDRARTELTAFQEAMERSMEMRRRSSSGDDIVVYQQVQSVDFASLVGDDDEMPEQGMVLSFNNGPVLAVDPGALQSLEQHMRVIVSSQSQPSIVLEQGPRGVVVVHGGGERNGLPLVHRSEPAIGVGAGAPSDTAIVEQESRYTAIRTIIGDADIEDSLKLRIRRSIRQVRGSLQFADSIMRRLRNEINKHEGGDSHYDDVIKDVKESLGKDKPVDQSGVDGEQKKAEEGSEKK
ncbi:MAG: hypothetical protein JST22_14090 [Bacteroidetes bacterium]|nr:hypothetical protein [Bacteroidota bacterium]